MSLLQEGQVIRGTYEVERLLGEGAFAEVYRVKHRFLGRQAMKVLKWIGMTVEETVQVLGEAAMLSRMGHPNIIRVFDANITETSKGVCGFFTMEYVAGGSLDKFWRSHGTQLVPVDTAVEIIRQACRGLSVAHGENPPIVHRDIKPQNILVGYDANGIRVRISDFGLAKRVNPLTLLASARGTRCFKPPEAFKESKVVSCAGDVWALGTTLYLLLTDRLPFSSIGELDVFDDRCFERPMIPASRLNLRVDAALDCILARALVHNSKERYPSAIELLEDLIKWRPIADEAIVLSKTKQADLSKSALGDFSPADKEDKKEAQKMIAKAIRMSRQGGQLIEAADIMEEAFNKYPHFRGQYEYQVKLWRRGIAM